ncbi:MAG TPA: energy transducer TonB [Candidatus Acidoferrum sp.]|nr:energy transducer TonB [Candidatus Acidoferrum sp.]
MGYVSTRKKAGILAAFLIATVPVCSKADTPGSPVVVHRKVGSEACELMQRGSFILDKEFAWVVIEGEKEPVYSPELGPHDYLSVSSEVSRRTSKDAHKSGFELKQKDSIPGDIPLVRGLRGNANCPDLQSAIAEVEQSRILRRSKFQAKIYQPGSDGVLPPTPMNSDQGTTPSTPTNGTDAKQKVTYHGTVVLNVVIGIDGDVEQTQVVRSADPFLDQKAAEKVSEWKFLPARKRGLPVRSALPVVINFNLH